MSSLSHKNQARQGCPLRAAWVALQKMHLPQIGRWRHRHGFGLHSPWVYEFVRDVLFEPNAYYAFRTLRGTPADEQLYRLALWLPADSLMVEGLSEQGRRHILAAKNNIHLAPCCEDDIGDDTCLVTEDIRRRGKAMWQRLLAHPRRTAAFDIRLPASGGQHRGIAFFSPARQRQVYTL